MSRRLLFLAGWLLPFQDGSLEPMHRDALDVSEPETRTVRTIFQEPGKNCSNHSVPKPWPKQTGGTTSICYQSSQLMDVCVTNNAADGPIVKATSSIRADTSADFSLDRWSTEVLSSDSCWSWTSASETYFSCCPGDGEKLFATGHPDLRVGMSAGRSGLLNSSVCVCVSFLLFSDCNCGEKADLQERVISEVFIIEDIAQLAQQRLWKHCEGCNVLLCQRSFLWSKAVLKSKNEGTYFWCGGSMNLTARRNTKQTINITRPHEERRETGRHAKTDNECHNKSGHLLTKSLSRNRNLVCHWQKGFSHLFAYLVTSSSLLETFLSPFSSLSCRTPFAGLLLW